MRRILCLGIALALLLCGCSPSRTEVSGYGKYEVYEFSISVEYLSGWPFGNWEFTYIYNGEEISSGHQIQFPTDIFAFHTIQVEARQRHAPGSVYSTSFPIAICDGGSGETEITVTGRGGFTAEYKITCNVTKISNE